MLACMCYIDIQLEVEVGGPLCKGTHLRVTLHHIDPGTYGLLRC